MTCASPRAEGTAYYENTIRGRVQQIKLGLLKLVFQKPSGKILGVHILGEDACELIHYGTALAQSGKTVRQVLGTTFAAGKLSSPTVDSVLHVSLSRAMSEELLQKVEAVGRGQAGWGTKRLGVPIGGSHAVDCGGKRVGRRGLALERVALQLCASLTRERWQSRTTSSSDKPRRTPARSWTRCWRACLCLTRCRRAGRWSLVAMRAIREAEEAAADAVG